MSVFTIPGTGIRMRTDKTGVKTMTTITTKVALIVVLMGAAFGQQINIEAADSAPGLAFARYLSTLQERNAFTEAGPVAIEIDASVPRLMKHARFSAIRETDGSERSAFQNVKVAGDGMVQHQVIARYLEAQQQAEALPYSSVAITPANYKFRFLYSIADDETTLYVFDIRPKHKRTGLIRGQLWIDSATGIAVRAQGVFVKRPSVFVRGVQVRRDVDHDGAVPRVRTTHVSVDARLIGRTELTITEQVMQTPTSRGATELIGLQGPR